MTKATTIAATTAAALTAVLAYSMLIVPASGATATPSTSASTPISNSIALPGSPEGAGLGPSHLSRGPSRGGYEGAAAQANLAVGQTITLTSTQGKFYVVGNTKQNGTASGTLTFTVTGKLASGFTLSISQGSIVVNGTTYTTSSGTAQMDRGASSLVGQGATTPSGQFLIRASARGSFVGTSATMSMDFGTGSTEYLVILTGPVK